MKWVKSIGLMTVIVVLLFITSCNGNELEQNHSQSQIQDRGELVQDPNLKQEFMEINNIKRGNIIKEKLDHQPEVTHFHHNEHDTSHYLDHEVAVQFKHKPSSETLKQMEIEIDGRIINQDGQLYLFRSKSLETPALLHYFEEKDNVDFAEPQYLLMQNQLAEPVETLPNDQLYMEQYQWNLPAIETESGWEISRGSQDVTIAVIDTGVDLDHPDLINRLVDGYNVVGDNSYPDDDNGHGTHVAGIIASETNNREGIAGLTWYSKIMPIKAMGAEGYGTTFDIAKGIIWAVDHGADVINLSLGNYKESNVLERAIEYAYNKNVIMVAAAGNDASTQPSYPAAYSEVLGVTAVNLNRELAQFSNYGNYVNVSAPGEYIPSTYYNEQYAALSGTSMAAPHVAGLAGLIKSLNPQLSNKEVMNIIEKTSVDLGQQGKDPKFGYGMIDINNALRSVANQTMTTNEKIQNKINFHW